MGGAVTGDGEGTEEEKTTIRYEIRRCGRIVAKN